MKKVMETIRGHERFVLATHLNPDGDAIGSAVGLGLALRAMGKDVTVYDRDGVPEAYSFLPESGILVSELAPGGYKEAVLIVLDCNTPERAGLDGSLGFRTTVVIDHHQTGTDFGDIRWVEPREAATGIMVYRLITALGVEVTREIATNLYAAVAIDTGIFRYQNTTADVLEVGAALVRAGADPADIAEKLYQSWSAARFRLFSMAMSEMEMAGPIAMIHVTLDMHEQTGTVAAETETFVNYPLVMDSVTVSVLLKEKEDGLWKVSLRSKGDVDVSGVAAMFSGGGHRNAAGCTVTGQLMEAKHTLIDALHDAM